MHLAWKVNGKNFMNRLNIFLTKVQRYIIAIGRQFYEQIVGNKNNKTILIIMPASSGSLGDQAMLESIVDNLQVLGMTSFRQILLPNSSVFPVVGPQLPWMRINPDDINENNSNINQLISRSGAVVAIGADVIDGRYGMKPVNFALSLLTLAARYC